MDTEVESSEYRFDKQRADAAITLSSGRTLQGRLFLAGGSSRHDGPERVADLLNSEAGFFPFEIDGRDGSEIVLLNRAHVVTVTVPENEASLEPGYGIARRRVVAMVLADNHRLTGIVRVYRPEGRDRLSDWARQPETFRYVEADGMTVIVNTAHVVELSEIILL
jgi:hypothetical protein